MGRIRVPLAIAALALMLANSALSGESFLLDREPAGVLAASFPRLAGVISETDACVAYLVAGAQVWPYRWTSVLAGQEPVGRDVGRVIPLAVDGANRWLLLIAQNERDYELWRQDEEDWTRTGGGGFENRITVAAGGRFAPGEGAGLFAQFDTGRIGYWQVRTDGCLPLWQSPDLRPPLVDARSADLDGDGWDELIAVGADGMLSVCRWRDGTWQAIWFLPPWGEILAFDVAQADSQPGLEIAVVTKQRWLFLIGTAAGSFVVRAKGLVTAVATANLGLIPQGNGAIVLGDAMGALYLYLPEAGAWRLEARLGGEEPLSFLAGLGPERVLAATVSGSLRIQHFIPLARLAVYLDGEETGNSGLYWEDGEFYFSPESLRRLLNLSYSWDEKKSRLVLTYGKLRVTMEAGGKEAVIDGRAWPLARPLVSIGKTPYVPAGLLRAVFLVNVTFDPASEWLILTCAAPAPG